MKDLLFVTTPTLDSQTWRESERKKGLSQAELGEIAYRRAPLNLEKLVFINTDAWVCLNWTISELLRLAHEHWWWRCVWYCQTQVPLPVRGEHREAHSNSLMLGFRREEKTKKKTDEIRKWVAFLIVLLRLNLKWGFVFSEQTSTEGLVNVPDGRGEVGWGNDLTGVTCLWGMLSGLNAESLWSWRWPSPRQSVGRTNGWILVAVALANFMVWLFGHLNNQSGYTSSGGLDAYYSGIKVRRGVSCKG